MVRAGRELQALEASFNSPLVCGIGISRQAHVQFLFRLAYTWTCVLTVQSSFTRFAPSDRAHVNIDAG